MPRLGSRLFELPRHKDSQRESLARLYAAEALKDEEDLLTKELPGYAAYKQTVKYRIIPFVW